MKIKYLIFDLDNTLYDLKELLQKGHESLFYKKGYDKYITYKQFLEKFIKEDIRYWEMLERKEIDLETLRKERIYSILKYFNIDMSLEEKENFHGEILNEIYNLMEPNIVLNNKLKQLSSEYIIALLTNGYSKEQRNKLINLNLNDIWGDNIFISGETGYTKPDKMSFINIINKLKIDNVNEAMMIGDSLNHDIIPANRIGMKTCWISSEPKSEYSDFVYKDIKTFLDDIYII